MPEDTVDLRSDTVTRPTPAMRAAMAAAEVGDDVFGDDPTVHRLEARIAELAGLEASLFVPSGTMGNQLAVRCHVEAGDEALVDVESHVFLYEQGGLAANSGALAHPVAGDAVGFVADSIDAAMRAENEHVARLKLVCLENTHNVRGGTVLPLERQRAVIARARAHGVRVHLDGARLWNASVATGIPIREWATGVDSLMMCFSKGLGAPIGSILAGSADLVRRARRHRKRWGGGMRQVGVLAAACLHAIDHHVDRLADDHRRARRLAAGFAEAAGVTVPVPQTNIVLVTLDHPALDPTRVLAALESRGVRLVGFGGRRLRAIAHLDVDDRAIERAIQAFRAVVNQAVESPASR
jgi:threonine aldolase